MAYGVISSVGKQRETFLKTNSVLVFRQVDLVVANRVKENRLAVLHFYLSRISQSRSLNFFCNVERAHAHGCQVGGTKQSTGQKMYRFIKKELLLGGFKLLKSGNCNHKSFGGLIPIKNNANEMF